MLPLLITLADCFLPRAIAAVITPPMPPSPPRHTPPYAAADMLCRRHAAAISPPLPILRHATLDYYAMLLPPDAARLMHDTLYASLLRDAMAMLIMLLIAFLHAAIYARLRAGYALLIRCCYAIRCHADYA